MCDAVHPWSSTQHGWVSKVRIDEDWTRLRGDIEFYVTVCYTRSQGTRLTLCATWYESQQCV